MDSSIDQPMLPHLSLNEEHKTSVMIIHGAFDSSKTWRRLEKSVPHHLLIPDLPQHGKAAKLGPLTFEYTASLLTKIIGEKARNGKVHLVGHSMGANLALFFATHHPDLVLSVYVSGTARASNTPLVSYGMSLEGLMISALPERLINHFIDAKEDMHVKSAWGGFRSLGLSHNIVAITSAPLEDFLSETATRKLKENRVRVLAVAATKQGALPTNDNEDTARFVARSLGGIAAAVPSMRHAMHVQDPDLLGQAISNWIQESNLPDEFIILNL